MYDALLQLVHAFLGVANAAFPWMSWKVFLWFGPTLMSVAGIYMLFRFILMDIRGHCYCKDGGEVFLYHLFYTLPWFLFKIWVCIYAIRGLLI